MAGPVEIVMPRLSDSMEEGTILQWLKQDGDQVERGDPLVEIETDKANMVYESDASGVLTISAVEGSTLPVGTPIASLGAGESSKAEAVAAAEPAAPNTTPVTEPTPVASPAQPRSGHVESARIKASPLARRVAKELGVDLAMLSGTGPGGRIVRSDVENAAESAPVTTTEAPPEPVLPVSNSDEPETAKGRVEIVELTKTQQVIARRMAEAKAIVPEFTLQAVVNMDRAVDTRNQLKELEDKSSHSAPSLNDLIVKACGLALRRHPLANGAYRDGHFELHSRVNVGFAVAGEGVLVVPTLFDADTRSLGEIASEARRLSERVRSGEITPPELSGGTFTVSNLGMYGIRNFTAIINPPQAAILACGEVSQRPAVVGDEVVPQWQMELTLACDHRILYGANAAEFLATVRELLEHPAELFS